MATRYWVGGSGSWNTTTNWSATSGGAGGASIPISTDDVIFDANSGLTSGTVSTCNIAFTINNLTITPNATTGINYLFITVSLTINGTMSCSATAGNRRLWIRSSNYGIGVNLTIATASSLADLDFRDIYVLGTASPISGTRIGNNGNCTGITFSAPKTVYWNLAGSQLWISNGWAATSGGTPADSNFPLAQDTAVFDNAGSITTLNINNTTPYVPTVNFSTRTSPITLTLSSSTIVYGNWSNGFGVTLSGTNTLTFAGGTTQTITSAGKTFSCPITVDTYGGTVQLADALNLGSTNNLTVTNGTFNTQGYAVTCGQLSSSNSNVRTINLGASSVTIPSTSGVAFTTATNLTFNAGTSTITIGSAIPILAGGSQVFYNVSFSGGSSTVTITGTNTFNNLTFASRASGGIAVASFGANQTINGTLTLTDGASATGRTFLSSSTIGTQRTLTCAAISGGADYDFRDIAIAGAAAGVAPTRAGDCGNNSGITFPAPKTVYWNLAGSQNWSATGWATSSGGSPAVDNFPLAQDTAVFDNTGSAGTVTIDAAWNIGTFDASLRTSAMTLTTSTNSPVYGDWKFGTGVTSSSTTSAVVFSKPGTQTIISNGVQFGCPVTVFHPSNTVQLADAISLGASRFLTLTSGTFDAVTYNVTAGAFQSVASTNTLKMGSGTWTISGTGSVWTGNGTVIAGTSTIVLSNTSTSARTFTGGGLYYNKLTIGGTTGTSTLTISGANTFGELASTKTVAHTIRFTSSTAYNIGKWSVTGTVGNVVTVNSNAAGTAFTLSIAGPANSGIDYLSVQDCAVSTISAGEFYVGANSTNVSGNTGAIIFTATPAARTLYWVGGTGNWSSTTKWATSSGGASGAAIPTSLDAVNFDSLSNATAYTATIDAGVTIARCAAFTMAGPASGNVTWAGTVGIAFHGNVSLAATGITHSYRGRINLTGSESGSYVFTANSSFLLADDIVFSGFGLWTLGSAVTIGNGKQFSITSGSIDTAGYAVTGARINVSATPVRKSLTLGSSTITNNTIGFTVGSAVNFTFNSNTSNIVNGNNTSNFDGGGFSYYNVTLDVSGTNNSQLIITGVNTFNNLTFTGRTASVGITAVTFSANQTINGTLTLGAGTTAAYRTFLASDTIGTPRTLTVTTLTAGATDIDFRDITIAGAAAPLTGTRFGDAKGNSGITFPATKTVYYRQTGSANWGATGTGSWSATSGGAFDATMFPLAQDTAIFPAATYPASGSTTTINANYNIGTIDMSLRTSNTMTLATGTTTPQIYGNWINGTGTTLTGSGTMTFAGRGSQTITSAGKTFTQDMVFSTPGGSITLLDAYTNNRLSGTAIQQNQGTFDANGYNVTLSNGGFFSNNPFSRTVAIGSGTWVLGISGGAWTATTSTNLTVTGTGTISLTSASAKTFAGGSISYSGITLNQGGAGTLTISGNNTFANITNTYGATGATTISLANTTQTVGAFTAAGTAGKLLTITGTSAASPATLIYSGGGVISGVDYVVPTFVRAYPTTTTWYAGANSTNGGSLGWIFTAPPSGAAATGNFLIFFQ